MFLVLHVGSHSFAAFANSLQELRQNTLAILGSFLPAGRDVVFCRGTAVITSDDDFFQATKGFSDEAPCALQVEHGPMSPVDSVEVPVSTRNKAGRRSASEPEPTSHEHPAAPAQPEEAAGRRTLPDDDMRMRQLQAELDAQQAALAAARKALDEEKAASEAKIAADAKAHRERVAKDNAELNERLAELDARSKILHAEREELKKQQAAVTPASRNENETYARAFAGNQPVVELPAAPSRNKTARRSVVESDGQPELNAAQQLRQNEVVESLHGRLLKEAEAAAKEAARLEDDRRRVEEVERRSAEAKRAQAELEQRQADERRLAQEDNRRQAEARRLQAEPQGHTGPVDHVQLEALNTTRDHTAATYAAVLKCRTFVDYRIMVLTIIAAPHDGTLQFYGLKRTDTPPSRSLLATNADFTSFVQYLESIGTRPSETVVEWEWVGLPDASRRAPETSVVSCQLDPGPQRTVHTDASAGLPATVPVLKDAYLAQPSRPSVLLHELPQPALRSARYVRCRHTRLGTVYHIPFTVEYPPSFWLLQQQCAHYFDIPERFLQLHFTCDGIPNVLSVVTDTDVLGVASLSLEPNATLHIVDGRM